MSAQPFNATSILSAPSAHGVYFLFDDDELIYVGQASGTGVTIYSRLASHLSGAEGPCTAGATHFGYEVTIYPVMREGELLRAFKSQNGRLPRCNDRF